VILLPGLTSSFVDPASVEQFQFTYTGSDGGTYTGYINAKDAGERDFTNPFQPINVVYFGDGKMIVTPDGPVAVEALCPADMVCTVDHGAQPLRWTGRRMLSAEELALQPDLRPIVLPRDALGERLPDSDLVLSPNHRVALHEAAAELLFAERRVLVAAKLMVPCCASDIETGAGGIAYIHLLYDHHEVVLANGLPCESLYPGPVALDALDDAAHREIRAVFPEVFDPDNGHGARRNDPAQARGGVVDERSSPGEAPDRSPPEPGQNRARSGRNAPAPGAFTPS
jgi:hypothetical protein